MGEMKYLELHGDRVAYQDVGTGPEALLLIHGMAGSSETWRAVLPQLSRTIPRRRTRPAGSRTIREAPGRLLARRIRGVAAGPARRVGNIACDDRRPIVGRRRGHAVRLPTSRLLRAADPDQQRRPRARCRLDASHAVGARGRTDPSGHRAAPGSDCRQQAALVVLGGRDSVTPRRGDVERVLIAGRFRDATGLSCGHCARWSIIAVRRSVH